jgi:alpha-tubulin suppressor-like RCC1 family protein
MWRLRFTPISFALAAAFSVSNASAECKIIILCLQRILIFLALLYSWGSSQFGQLGLGDDKDKHTPELVKALLHENPKLVRLGGSTSCVVTENGHLFTFGKGQDGSLGHGDVSNESLPRLVEDLVGKKVVQVGLSMYHVGAVTEDGQLFMWGRYLYGQLGSDARKKDYSLPKLVDALKDQFVVSVACGDNHTLVLTKEGKVYSFGAGRDYGTGFGNKNNQFTPTVLEFDSDVKISQIAAGNGFSLFLDSNGKLYSCGNSEYGKLGHGRGDLFEMTPRVVRSLQGVKIVSISAGEYHAAALSEDGLVYTWGLGKDGQNGNAATTNSDVPRIVSGLKDKKVRQISCGGGHSAALTDKGELYLWGRGRSGQLGRGTQLESVSAYRTEPREVEFFKTSNLQVKMVSLGSDHSSVIVEKN